ncbi:NADH oxidase domain protein [Secundilactobacillus oryzae JCM 18671]|uniref:NADH oxidase domain protein n=1 Tax=Secundilactobacillus oryzae JCM 18671 TaxID=1291743 RepID=A0A081BHG5_9LACO|nr:NADH-dependent flavin oxidoreductase [Secundilactobacillus oryzae]GAK47483.1 NADH oxidase domain protein [Secundilactobacillus oryzae JCM 18671]
MKNWQFLNDYTLRNGVKLANRIVMAPMTEQSSFEDGTITTDEIEYYRLRAGAIGMLITGCANVNDLGKGFEGELSAANTDMLPGLRRLANATSTGTTKSILQIFSAGRMTNTKILRGEQPVSASAVPSLQPNAETPRELTPEEVEQTIKDFGNATKLAIEAGFDGVELHGANTYLIQQFFSPHSNRRTDKWGGSLEKRMAFPLAVVSECAQIIKNYADRPFILGYRLSPEEREEPGIRLADTLELVKALNETPIDYLHISLADAKAPSIVDKTDPEPVFAKIKSVLSTDLPLITVGHVASPDQAESIIEAGNDFVAIGRELIREPHWLQKVQNGDEDSIRYTISKSDMAELRITRPLWQFLVTAFKRGFPLSTDEHQIQH